MELIKDFQNIMNQAIEQLLKKTVRKHSRQKDEHEPRMNRESIRKAYAKKQKRFNQETSAENLMISETVGFCWRQWIQIDVSKS